MPVITLYLGESFLHDWCGFWLLGKYRTLPTEISFCWVFLARSGFPRTCCLVLQNYQTHGEDTWREEHRIQAMAFL